MKKISHEMKAWGFEEKTDFNGLVPTANESLPVIGKELEVTDIDAIANSEPEPIVTGTTENDKVVVE